MSRLSLAILLALSVVGCLDANLVTGIYRSQQPVNIEGSSQWPSGGLYMELVLGHYGPDVTGLVRFFTDEDCLIPIYDGAPCRFIDAGGRFETDRHVLFSFASPFSGKASGQVMGASLVADETGDVLSGKIGLLEPSQEEIAFKRIKLEQDLSDSDKQCDDKVGEPGNG